MSTHGPVEGRLPETEAAVVAALKSVAVPGLGTNIADAHMIRDIAADPKAGSLKIRLHLSSALEPQANFLETACLRALYRKLPDYQDISIDFSGAPAGNDAFPGARGLSRAAVVAVYSAKGGVGKSTVAVNLAAEAAARGLTVGLLDADLFGPSIPLLMGVDAVPPPNGDILPPLAHGVHVMSTGFLIRPGQSMVWRGPVLHQAVQRLFSDVAWPEVDLLIVDLPPGTGDVMLSLSQTVRLSGAVVVTTPQPVALSDVERGLSALEKLSVPVLGLVENMCGPVFGSGGGRELAEDRGIRYLGSLDLAPSYRLAGDAGVPVRVYDSGSPASAAVEAVFDALSLAVDLRAKERV